MRNEETKLSSRILAGFLTMIMVLSLIPFSAISAVAATADHEDWGVTITVNDENGDPLPGATVTYHVNSAINGDDYATGTETTDEKGSIEVLTKDKYVENDLTLSATVTKEDYVYASGYADIADVSITSDDQDFVVQMRTTKIKDVTVTATSITYDGNEHPAAVVTGIKDGDTVTYKLGDNAEQNEMPTIIEPDTYSLVVTVQRDGFDDFSETVQPVISKATIELNVVEYSASYDKAEHPAITVTGLLNTDTVTYSLNGAEAVTEIPSIINVGDYSLAVHVERHGYNDFDYTYDNIHIVATLIDGLSATSYQGTYDGTSHDAVTVSGAIAGDKVEYKLGDGDWSEEIPQIKDAGNYTVLVRVTRTNYLETNVDVLPANAYIAKAAQNIEFDHFTGTSGTDQVEGEVPFNKTYNFKATDTEALAGGTVSYAIEVDEDGIASIDNEGILTVNYPGTITVTATLTGNENYEVDTATYTLEVSGVVSAQGQYISFENEEIDYVLGTSDTISNQEAKKNNIRIKGTITYSIDKKPGLSFNAGVVEVTDYDALAEAIRATTTGTLKLTVTATKSASGKYGEDTASYVINVRFGDAPATPYTLPTIDGTNDWYKTKTGVVITPADGYSISQAASGPFKPTTEFNNEGTADRYIYLRNNNTQAITDQILVSFKLDTISPAVSDMTIEFSELNMIQKIGSALGFYNPDITITFTAKDFNSGIDHFNWTYSKEEGVSTKNKVTTADQYLAVTYDEETHTATATLTLPADEAEQLHGKISFTATDKAGNVSDSKGEEYVFIVDTISPTINVAYSTYSYKDESTGRTYYGKFAAETQIDGKVDVTFTVDEANFDKNDVVITLTKYNNIDDITGTDTDISAEVVWTDESVDVHIGTYTITGDGHYLVNFSYHDKSYKQGADKNGTITTYTTPAVITIDTTDPELNIEFIHSGNDQKVKFTVTEHNFLLKKDSISVTGTMKDIQGKDISYTTAQLTTLLQGAEWTTEGNDVYSFTTDQFPNGIYNLSIDYTDIATNVATKYTADEFIIDHAAPTGVKIEIITDPIDTILEVITFGFYNPNVKIRFTAYDTAAGVQSFIWNYTKENGASDRNRATDTKATTVDAVQDSSDSSKFTAEITLPDTDAKQLRGYLAVYATDTYSNSSDKVTDAGNIIVVDSVAPNMKVEYSEASRSVGTNHYYGSDKAGKVDVTISLDEANFISTIAKYTDKVEVMLSSDGGNTYSRVYPTWTDKDVDTHIGTYTISGDGHYKLAINYSDNAGNPTDINDGSMYTNSDDTYKYVSDLITIDTIVPTISVNYDDDKIPVVQTLDDNVRGNKANTRKYYADQKVATITIVEHNFDANEVDFTILAKDITGTVLSSHSGEKPANDPNLIKFGAWQTTGDTHTITITYPGDANYEFDVAYTDLATNAAADYAIDYITVDKTAPTIVKVDYSTSVLDTVLNSLTFGFYNAKMTVTITAEDETSSVRSFLYNYRNAAGVSAVNAELINQVLEEANGDITYSDEGKTATISFEIPKMVLGNDNQFNGTVDFTATDRSDNKAKHEETKRIVVDNIAPTAQVSYNEATHVVGDISYFNGDINATVTINEANFYKNDVQVMVSKDGGAATAVTPDWSDNSVDVHVGTFTLKEDGDYIIIINYKDKSSNTMTEYRSKQLTIDTKIEEPTYKINNVTRTGDDGKAYKGDATVEFNFEDQNFDTKTITLTRKRYNDETVVYDSEKTGVNDFGVKLNMNDKGGSGTITIPDEVANDGIYTLKITMTDKALHPTDSYVKFAITRYGSVYEYNNDLVDLIKEGGQYKKSIEDNLIIKEYNAVPITNESLKITITRDGEAIDVDYTSDPSDGKEFETVGIGDSGWYEYVYTIKAENFKEDGVYNITLSSLYDSLDASGNSVSTSSTSVPDNSIDADGNKILDVMKFTVDDTAPEIRNIINLDKEIADRDQIKDGKLTVTYTIIDVGGLKTIEVTVNGKTETISKFDDASSYTGTFVLNESSDKQAVQIKVTDLAGNVTNTADDSFKNAHKANEDPYIFNDTITVSTNIFVRWYANTPLFWGSIGGVVLVAGGFGAAIAAKRKKKAKA